jgi:hypothetical protein
VSGGSYIASSRALVAHNLPPGTVPRAYSPGTAEERNLRGNTRYIAPNGATVLVGVLSLLLGAIVTFIIVTAPIYALTHAWGWLLRGQGVLVPAALGDRRRDHAGAVRVLVADAGAAAAPPGRPREAGRPGPRTVVGLAEAGRPGPQR